MEERGRDGDGGAVGAEVDPKGHMRRKGPSSLTSTLRISSPAEPVGLQALETLVERLGEVKFHGTRSAPREIRNRAGLLLNLHCNLGGMVGDIWDLAESSVHRRT